MGASLGARTRVESVLEGGYFEHSRGEMIMGESGRSSNGRRRDVHIDKDMLEMGWW